MSTETTASGKDADDHAPGPIPGVAKDYWLALCTPTHSASKADITATLPTHLTWLHSIEERNQLFMAGPLLSGPEVRLGSGIMIFRATDEAEAHNIANQDPFVLAGLRTIALYQWRLNEGSVSLRISLSQGNYDWR